MHRNRYNRFKSMLASSALFVLSIKQIALGLKFERSSSLFFDDLSDLNFDSYIRRTMHTLVNHYSFVLSSSLDKR